MAIVTIDWKTLENVNWVIKNIELGFLIDTLLNET